MGIPYPSQLARKHVPIHLQYQEGAQCATQLTQGMTDPEQKCKNSGFCFHNSIFLTVSSDHGSTHCVSSSLLAFVTQNTCTEIIFTRVSCTCSGQLNLSSTTSPNLEILSFFLMNNLQQSHCYDILLMDCHSLMLTWQSPNIIVRLHILAVENIKYKRF